MNVSVNKLVNLERLSCSTICFREFSLETALQSIEEVGIQYVDIGTMPGFCPHFDFLESTEQEEKEFIRTVRASSLKLHTFTTDISDVNETEVDSKTYLKAGRRNIRVAAELGAYGINVNCGKYHDRSEHSFYDDVQIMGEHIGILAEEAEQSGLKILIEAPHKGKLIRNALEAKLLLDACNHTNVYLIFDINHHHAAGWRMDDVIKVSGDRLLHVHLRDAIARDNQYPLGTGEIDIPLLFKTLNQTGYKGMYGFEFTGASDTVEGNKKILLQSIDYLKSLNH